MNSDAELLRGLYDVTRGALDGAAFRVPDIVKFIANANPIRIKALPNFWVPGDGVVAGSLHQVASDLLCGLHGQQGSLVFLVESEPPYVRFWIGGAFRPSDKRGFRASLFGAYPDIRIDDSIRFFPESIASYPLAAIVSGVPSRKSQPGSAWSDDDQIEKLCRGLADKRWLFAVCADALPMIETLKASNEVAAQIRDVQSKFLLKNSATDHENRLAKHFIDLLESHHGRIERGRSQGMWAVRTVFFAEDGVVLGRAKGLLAAAYGGRDSIPQPVRIIGCDRSASEDAPVDVLNSEELAVLTRFSKREWPGYGIFEHAQFGLNVPDTPGHQGSTLRVGAILDGANPVGLELQIPRSDLAKHAFVVGVTGSGKTNTCFSLLEQIWNGGKGVPFLIIEPAKSEYRQLLTSSAFQGLNIFTVADETVSPLRLNPLFCPPGTLIQSHIDFIKTLFGAAFVLYPPMPFVLEQSLQEVYVDRGWDLASNINRRGDASEPLVYPMLSDLALKITEVVDRMGYDEHLTMDIKAGLLARVTQLCRGGGKGRMLDTRQSIPLEVLFRTPCLLELKQLVSDEEKAFVIGLILIYLHEFCELEGVTALHSLRHVTLIEEAHRLLRNTSTEQGSEVHANPRGHAIEVFGNILAEIRAFGEGMIIAEQIPGKLAPDVLKNTNLKIVHRLVADDDREHVGAAMNLDAAQKRYLAGLKVGQAVAYAENLEKAVLIRAPLSALKDGGPVAQAALRQRMIPFFAKYERALMNHRGCAQCNVKQHQRAECQIGLPGDVDTRIHQAFRWILNAIRLNRALVWDAYGEFESILGAQENGRVGSSYCVIVGLTNREIEYRARSAGWQYPDVNDIVDLLCEALWYLSNDYGIRERGEIEIVANKHMLPAYQLFERLHRVNRGPYPGCKLCAQPCAYRFDMAQDAEGLASTDFEHTIRRSDAKLEWLAGICWNATSDSFLPKDVLSRRGAALCFAVQQVYGLENDSRLQEKLVSELANELSTYS